MNHLYLLYHELRTAKSAYSYAIEKSEFQEQLDLFVKVRASAASPLCPEITFDDGHMSDYSVALPALVSRGLKATFFITVGWTAVREGYMGWQELRALHASEQIIGAHGWSHALLTHCSDDELKSELSRSRLTLEDKLGTAITSMSLPGGRYDRRVLKACYDAGYKQVYNSMPRPEPADHGPFVGRLNVRSGQNLDWFSQLLDPASGVLARIQRQDRWKTILKKAVGDQVYSRIWATLNRHQGSTESGESAGA